MNGKVVLVTGSTTGIGEAIARAALADGASVAFHGRNSQRGDALAAEFGSKAAFFQGDLADAATPARLVAEVVARFGQLDALVNNAAATLRGTLDDTDSVLFDRVMATNCRAPLLLIRAARPALAAARGAVLNIGSVNGYCGEANLLAYSVAKGALVTLSRNLADSLGRDRIRVNHFNVGWVLTSNELQYKIDDGLPNDWPRHVDPLYAPSGRLIKPEEIAQAALYFISDRSGPISGSVVDLEQYPMVGRNPPKTVA